MAARQTRGRQRIPMRLIQNQDDLYASFSKRRLGLFKKASELSTLCGADVGVIVFSPTDNPFSFFSPTMDSVVDRYAHPDRPPRQSARAIDSHARARIHSLNTRLDDLLQQKLRLKEYHHQLHRGDQAWWEETPVDGLDKEQVREWTAWFNNLKARVEEKVAQLRNGGSSSSMSVPGYVPAAPASYSGANQFAPPLNFLNSPPMDQFYRGVTHGGGEGGHVFSSEYYVSAAEGGDPFAAGSSGDGGGEVFTGAPAYGGLMPPSHSAIIPSASLCFPPSYFTVASEVQNPSAAAGEEEAAASNQGRN